jgi:hypothetical protein
MKKFIFSILFVLQVYAISAQSTSRVTGKVVESDTQAPIRGVVVSIQNTPRLKITNADGTFIIDNVPVGNQFLLVRSAGYLQQLLPITVKEGETLDLGLILFEEDLVSERQLSLITLTEDALADDNSGSESSAGMLQATRDAFLQVAAFNLGQARFRVRGLDNEYGVTMINGITMNKLFDGRPQWSNWGGLNDATRNQEFTYGSRPSDYTFGGILGTQSIYTRASIYRPGSRISMAATNTNYDGRLMATVASGLSQKGWAYVLSASRRFAQEGHFDGTDYAANSFFASIEKKINYNHQLNLTTIYAQNSRGKNSPNTAEVNDIMGIKYNSYWGWQDGKKRNSRDKDVEEPMAILSHYWNISPNARLNTNVSYQQGRISNSRLENPLGNNPDPTYYRKLPSYYLNDPDSNITITNPDGSTTVTNPNADAALQQFLANSQIDWSAMYVANQNTVSGESAFALTEQRNDDKVIHFNSLLNASLSNNIILNAGVNYKNLKSHNYAVVTDLLGGDYLLNVDRFFSGDNAQFDLNNPNAQVVEGGTFGYNYNLRADVADAFAQFKFTYSKIDFYFSQTFSRTEYQREGLFRSGNYASNSYGKSGSEVFENFGFKGGTTIKLTGRHLLDFNGVYMTKAPSLRNSFYNARRSNEFTPDLLSERVFAGDASYVIRTPKLKTRITGFYTKVADATEIAFFYAENIGDSDGDEDSFVTEITSGIEKQNLGGEFGLEYQITPTIRLMGVAAYGEYTYTKNANLKTSDDNLASQGLSPLKDFGTTYIKHYRQPGMPQEAYSIGIEYRDPKFWWIGANYNYLDNNYISISKISRTDNFTIDNSTGISFPGATPESVRDILRQEKFDPLSLVNLTGGKSWRVSNKNRNTIGFFAAINNLLDVEYKTGGFEQSRKATYTDLAADNANGTPSFGPRYFYGYTRTYFVNLYYNF